ncbi:hypothetical protein ACFU8W_41430 [Streptomyces sp. NPDC057565]|uniref:hypothetical protein n=1 Tax=Streptomyces sp. NPDC057565 TaxID=3346169 RepID=UPI0036885586
MSSVLGLLEAREKNAREEAGRLREEAERVQAALGEAERVLQRLVDARVTVAEVLAEPTSAVAEPARSAVTGSVVPHRAKGMAASVLEPDYQQIMLVLESEAGWEGMRCQQLAVALGLEMVPAKVEGGWRRGARCAPRLRSKVQRLVERGWSQVRAPFCCQGVSSPNSAEYPGSGVSRVAGRAGRRTSAARRPARASSLADGASDAGLRRRSGPERR